MRRIRVIILAVLCSILASATAFIKPSQTSQAHGGAHVQVLTRSYNNARTGANLAETVLTPANVSAANAFGKLYARTVEGQIYAQPLYVPEITMVDGETHNVVFVATQKNNVYAFDADDSTAATPLWQVNLGPYALSSSGEFGYRYFGIYTDIQPTVGIVGSPVIDSSTGTLYLVTFVRDPNQPKETGYSHYLHALNIFTGAEKFNGPKKITAEVAGSGEDLDDPSNGIITFNSRFQLQRPSLLLVNGVVYVGFAGYADTDPYHGWMLGYDARTLEQRYVFCTTPDDDANNSQTNDAWDGEGGIWMSGQGASADGDGNIYFVAGNGNYSAASAGRNYGNSVLRVRPNDTTHTLDVQTYFTPYNYRYLNQYDLDLGVTTALLIPGTNLALAGSKEGKVYVVDRTAMGGLNQSTNNDSNARQSFLATGNINDHIHGSPTFWESTAGAWVYMWGERDKLRAFQFHKDTGLFDTSAAFISAYQLSDGMPGGIVSLSANGTDPNSGILWATTPVGDANRGTRPGMLRAYRATGPTSGGGWEPLWKSDDNPARDGLGNFAKFNPPMVADGKVFVGSFSTVDDPNTAADESSPDLLVVYGLLAPAIVEQPEPVALTYGDTTALHVTASGQSTLTYQWYEGASGDTSHPVVGQTSSTFTTGRLQTTTRFWVRVSNNAGIVDSTHAIVEVGRAATTLTLSGSATSSLYGQPLTFTANLSTLITGMASPSGTITFRDRATELATVPVNSGAAQLTISTLATGNHQITATYNGDDHFSQASAGAVGLDIQKATTTTTLSTPQSNLQPGQSIQLTARIAAIAPATGQPGGSVTFYLGDQALGNAAIDNQGQAVLAVSLPTPGTYQLSAAYTGSELFAESRAGVITLRVIDPPTEYRVLIPVAGG